MPEPAPTPPTSPTSPTREPAPAASDIRGASPSGSRGTGSSDIPAPAASAPGDAPLRVPTPAGQTWLHRFTVKPKHVDAYRPLFDRTVAAAARAGYTTHRVFLETDAEPKLTWLYSHPEPGAGPVTPAADPELADLARAAEPHVFRNLLVRPVRVEWLTHATPASVAGRIAIMRRYSIVGGWDAFLDVWRRIVPVREAYGFRCLFAVADEPKDLFTWAFDFAGAWADFPAAQRGYYHDPARVELRRVFDHMADYALHPAELVLPAPMAE